MEEQDDNNRIETIVKVSILIWSATLLTLSYWQPPEGGRKIVNFDPTFIASIFSASTASLGLSIGKKNNSNGNGKAPKIVDNKDKTENQ